FWRVDEDVTKRFVVVACPNTVSPPPCVPFPIVDEALDWKPVSTPREVSEEAVTPEASVLPVRLAAATVPEKEPEEVMLPTLSAVAKRLVEEAVVAKKLV